MSYQVLVRQRPESQLNDLHPETYRRVKQALAKLADEPRPRDSKKLSERKGWRIRVGDYRVIYQIDDSSKVVTVVYIGHRRDVYRKAGATPP